MPATDASSVRPMNRSNRDSERSESAFARRSPPERRSSTACSCTSRASSNRPVRKHSKRVALEECGALRRRQSVGEAQRARTARPPRDARRAKQRVPRPPGLNATPRRRLLPPRHGAPAGRGPAGRPGARRARRAPACATQLCESAPTTPRRPDARARAGRRPPVAASRACRRPGIPRDARGCPGRISPAPRARLAAGRLRQHPAVPLGGTEARSSGKHRIPNRRRWERFVPGGKRFGDEEGISPVTRYSSSGSTP